ncbi:MAG: hypothetical protein KIS76_17110 [Pyrinomonadaceae bacterium]|nr:hypothetical protein [Pyrinomonadaceae bacterium]
MKLIYSILISAALSFTAFSQCPEFKVVENSGMIDAGETVTFAAVFPDNFSLKNLSLEWSVNQGKSYDGDGTTQIRVITTKDMEGSNLVATLRVTGLPSNCVSTASETVIIKSIPTLEPLRTFSEVSWQDEFSYMDSLIFRLSNDPNSRGYIQFYVKRTDDINKVSKRINELFDHVDRRKFNRNLIFFDVCAVDESLTIHWTVPDGADVPEMGDCEKIYLDLN